MAVDKKEIERFEGAGPAALALLPPLDHYESPRALPIIVQGKTCDILAFDPSGAIFDERGRFPGRPEIEAGVLVSNARNS